MSKNRHDVENEGSKQRDHTHPRGHFWKRAHRDWRIWFGVILMLSLMLVYVMTNDLSFRPGKHAAQTAPETIP